MLNAGTAEDFTVYFVYLPANRLELWMDLESDRMDTPIFREFWIERDVVMEERRLADNDPDDVLDEAFNSVAFTACPYKWPVLGWMSDLLTIDRHELAAYHQRFYAPNNATACVVGDVDLEAVRKMAKKYFGPIDAQDPPAPIETREPEQKGERRVVVEHDANPRLKIGWHKPMYPDPDAVVFDVITSVLSDGRTSRLYTSIYEDQQLTASPPRAYTGPGNRYDNLMVVMADPRHPHTLEEVEQALYAEIDRLKTEPVADRELQRIKNQIDANQIRQLGSNLGIAFTIMMGQLYMGDYRAMFRYYDMIKEVTPEDVMRVADKYLTEKNRTVAWRVQVVPEEKGDQEGPSDEDMMKYRALLMQYIQSLPQEEQMQIFQKFQSLRSEQEQRTYGMELIQRAREAGFIKDE
jgi:predicted Zn-dependent peptidase